MVYFPKEVCIDDALYNCKSRKSCEKIKGV